MASKAKPIVIIGGGFGGVAAALALDRIYGGSLDTPIFLIDASPVHVYTPSLYEVANNHSSRVAVIPFEDILEGTNVRFIQEKVTHIDTEDQRVVTEHRHLAYADVIIALGSQACPFKDEHADPADVFSVKTLQDVLAIRRHIETCFRKAKAAPHEKQHTHFIVAGAGPTGVEFTGSLAKFLQLEAKHHEVPLNKTSITLVDAGERILSRLDPEMSRLAADYLKKQGVRIRLKTKISWQDHEKLRMNKEMVETETLIWTAGVKPHALLNRIKGVRHDDHGRVLVDGSLQVIDMPHVWVIGDAASVSDSGLALSAAQHGRHVALAIKASRAGKVAPAYHPQGWPAVIPLSDTFGIARVGKVQLVGFITILYKRWLDWRYYNSILPIPLAWRVWRSRTAAIEQEGVLGFTSVPTPSARS